MIRDYRDYLASRWYELDMPAKIKAAPDDEAAQKPIQCGWLVQVAGELAQTTAFEGREHPDVGLYFKDVGNFYDAGAGLKITTDVLCVCDTDVNGNVTDPQKFAIIDVIVMSLRHAAHPGWIVQGMAVGADRSRFRRPPEPVTDQPEEPGPGEQGPGGDKPPVDVGLGKVTVPEVVEQLKILIAESQKQTAVLEGIRRDIDNGGKLLTQLITDGSLGSWLGAILKRNR